MKQKRNRTKRDFTGMRIGKLVVIAEATRRGNNRYLLCQCDCGATSEISAGNFSKTTDQVKSCGCLKRSINRFAAMLPDGEKDTKRQSIVAAAIQGYRHSAKKRGHVYSLTDEEAVKLILGSCYYCGRVGECKKKERNGIDRVDSSKGYEVDNCVSCCIYCNQAKSDMTVDEFKQWLIKIYDHLIKDNYATI